MASLTRLRRRGSSPMILRRNCKLCSTVGCLARLLLFWSSPTSGRDCSFLYCASLSHRRYPFMFIGPKEDLFHLESERSSTLWRTALPTRNGFRPASRKTECHYVLARRRHRISIKGNHRAEASTSPISNSPYGGTDRSSGGPAM